MCRRAEAVPAVTAHQRNPKPVGKGLRLCRRLKITHQGEFNDVSLAAAAVVAAAEFAWKDCVETTRLKRRLLFWNSPEFFARRAEKDVK